ncbi:protein SGT1 homolog isoform X2 [Scyliorhinus canicula]|uniref:protein SGT1 homolog isoform X2 n=1 Tax=Scyliorhinus canicula TaxID=7830 RepID=UPI0018F44D99|nr:protein SGT1 homolog isoform X2 [Scyliorhinus canicula]
MAAALPALPSHCARAVVVSCLWLAVTLWRRAGAPGSFFFQKFLQIGGAEKSGRYGGRASLYRAAHRGVSGESGGEVVEDANKALQLKPNYASAYLKKGIAEYHLKMYPSSMESFTRGQELDDENASFSTWIKTCKENLDSTGQQDGNAEEAVPKIKHDWYQTDSHVIVTIMIKNASKDDVKVEFAESNVSASVKLSAENHFKLKLNLLHPIATQYCAVKVLGTKIEIKLKKTEATRWEKLEGALPDIKNFIPVQSLQYPSSSQCTRNWDKLVMEIKQEENDEKPEGDAALNQLFQKIYADGTDEVKRAMNKSFTESGGTVLSTNWTEVGNKTVAVNPPDDMEWKKL